MVSLDCVCISKSRGTLFKTKTVGGASRVSPELVFNPTAMGVLV